MGGHLHYEVADQDLLAGSDGCGAADAVAGRGDDGANPHSLLERKDLIALGPGAPVGHHYIHCLDAGPAQILEQPLGGAVGAQHDHRRVVMAPHFYPGVEHSVERRIGDPQGHRRHQ